MSPLYASPRWPAATTTLGVWGLAAASVVFWGLRLAAPADGLAPPPVSGVPVATIDTAAVAQLFGAPSDKTAVVAATPQAASRFALLGVVADSARQGAALIAVDGKPARPYRVGSQLVDGYVLQSVGVRSAALGGSVGSATAITLQLPVRPLALPAPLTPVTAGNS
ncbi:type II secretion system protein N [Variovorax sp. LT1R16]|uniref:type II secretion system protein N n=1 Tax=Variovorax sp. LT1R16 TaxID=3443728 RepID=UPI003F448963